jgi:hypothetical protein
LPTLNNIPLIQGGLDLADAILQAWVSQCTSDLDMESVSTISEMGIPVEGEPPFPAVSGASLPGVFAYVTTASPEWVAAQTVGLNYIVHWVVVVSDGRANANRKRHEQVREEIAALFGGFDIQGSTEFLSLAHTAVHFGDISMGEVQMGDANPYLLWSVNTMRCQVSMPNPRME